MALEEFTFPSHNGRDQIHAWIHTPSVPARGIVQIEHGLGEHFRRYLPLVVKLLDAGFVVAGDDHAGHGATAAASDAWADTGENGLETVIADEETLRERVTAAHPGLPYLVFGHSWGSMIARVQAARNPEGIAGLILGGIAAQIASMDAFDRAALEAAIGDSDGSASGEDFLGEVFAGFLDRYDDVRGPTDWVAADRGVVADHGADPLNRFGIPLSQRFLRDFIGLYDLVMADDWAEAIPATLPVLILAGDQDPVANYGEGAYHVANALVASGTRDVRTKVYSGYRHEVHNEPPIRDDVAAEIIAFAERVSAD